MKQMFLKNIPNPILLKLGKIDLSVPSQNCQAAIDELLSKSVLLGGKRLRPLLTYLFADLFGVELNQAEVSAKAIEMVHAASLAHDDVIDEATQRRERPSINIQSSNKKAVLSGDYLLAAVIGELTRQGNLRLVSEMAWVIEELASGEWIQSDAVLSKHYTAEILNQIAVKKTSSVMSWCAVAPAVLGNLDETVISKAKEFGYHLGLAFQLFDDTLDFSEDSQKDTLLDLKNGQVNSVIFQWLLLNPEVKQSYENGADISELFSDSHLDTSISKVEDIAKGHIDRCRQLLKDLIDLLQEASSLELLQQKREPIDFILNYLENRKS